MRRFAGFAGFAVILGVALAGPGWTAPPGEGCDAAHFVDQQLPSGARWQLCFEPRSREGVVLLDVYYTTPAGELHKILAEAGLAQLHVPYDDDGARFHDVTDFGLGDSHLEDLEAGDCPTGSLIEADGKSVLCQTIETHDAAYDHHGVAAPGAALVLFSVSHVGEYNYVVRWRFRDDGTLEPEIGATGRLQRRSDEAAYGWPIRSDDTVGVSHIHNYYWRLDFDLGAEGGGELVAELDLEPTDPGHFEVRTTPVLNEAARSTDLDRSRSWLVQDVAALNPEGRPIGVTLEPGAQGHRHHGPASEAFTWNDLYLTRHDPCERFVSHNPTLAGCAGDVRGFVNGESIAGDDVVVWYGLTFHHVPRDEDELQMHAHWNGFRIVPRDLSARNPLLPGAPALELPRDRVAMEGDAVDFSFVASDAENDPLTWSAVGLPAGVALEPGTGRVSGQLSAGAERDHEVTVVVSDGSQVDAATFAWVVQRATECNNGLDDDADGMIDEEDVGCVHAEDLSERHFFPCDDGFDNDGDGFVDWEDPECDPETSLLESYEPYCGLGFELVLLAPLGAWIRRRRSARTA